MFDFASPRSCDNFSSSSEATLSWSVLILKRDRVVIFPLLSLLCSYSNLLSISQIGHQWSDWLPGWITSLSWFHYLSGRQSRPAEPSKPSLNSSPRLRTIEMDWFPIENWWKKADVVILRVGCLTTSSQPSSCRFTHAPSGDRELFSLNHQIGKALALLWADTQARGLIRLS